MSSLATAIAAATPTTIPLCSTVLPVGAEIIALNITGASVVTLQSAATVFIDCPTPTQDSATSESTIDLSLINVDLDDVLPPEYFEYRDPFLASTFPICYALAAATITAWLLLMVLFMTPRIFLDGGVVYLGRWGFTNGSGGVRIGGRPWLQKVAVLLVAVTLTIASVDTFEIAKSQYAWGVQNATLLQKEVMGSTEIKSVGLIADTFLWLAQAQTLIRLFPRHRDQVFIKWAAFALIALDSLFSALNSFVGVDNGAQGNSRPRSFVEPISTISYLMHLALGLIYAGWVMYYVFTKRKYAIYHTRMPNMSLVAGISTTAVLIPVAFFIMDISKPEVIGWSEYVRWVGAAAASVAVWEWVERIEELEREATKDGILGRELVDGDDEGLGMRASESAWRKPRRNFWRRDGSGDENDDDTPPSSSEEDRPIPLWPGVEPTPHQPQRQRRTRTATDPQPYRDTGEERRRDVSPQRTVRHSGAGDTPTPQPWPSQPPSMAPVSAQRTDTPSTEYTVRYQSTESTVRTPDPTLHPGHTPHVAAPHPPPSGVYRRPSSGMDSIPEPLPPIHPPPSAMPLTATMAFPAPLDTDSPQQRVRWKHSLFRRPDGPPAVVAQHSTPHPPDSHSRLAPREQGSRWDLRSRVEEFASNQAERVRERMRPTPDTDSLPVTVIPAPARRGEMLAQVMEELDRENNHHDR